MIAGKLGKNAPLHNPKTLQLSKYLLNLPHIPNEFDWFSKVPTWPMYDNDTLGNCVEAAQGHMIEQWSTYANPPGVVLSDSQIVQAYTAEAGYVPGDPTTDNGTYMLLALDYWRKTGIAGHQIIAYVQLATGNSVELEAAVWLFGNAIVGLQLPLSVQNLDEWSVPEGGTVGDGLPGSWGGHCVPVVGMAPNAMPVITWGSTLWMTKRFYQNYSDEAYAVLSHDWLQTANNLSPESFDLAQLKADLQLIVKK